MSETRKLTDEMIASLLPANLLKIRTAKDVSFDELIEGGVYYAGIDMGITGHPTGTSTSYGQCFVLPLTNGRISQIFFPDQYATVGIFIRMRVGNNWKDWKKITTVAVTS